MPGPATGQERDLALAKNIFESWDTEKLGQLSFLKIADRLISLGLLSDANRALRILKMFKKGKHEDFLTEKEFLDCFKVDKLGTEVNRKILETFHKN